MGLGTAGGSPWQRCPTGAGGTGTPEALLCGTSAATPARRGVQSRGCPHSPAAPPALLPYVPRLSPVALPGKLTATTFALERPRCIFQPHSSASDAIWLVVALANGECPRPRVSAGVGDPGCSCSAPICATQPRPPSGTPRRGPRCPCTSSCPPGAPTWRWRWRWAPTAARCPALPCCGSGATQPVQPRLARTPATGPCPPRGPTGEAGGIPPLQSHPSRALLCPPCAPRSAG